MTQAQLDALNGVGRVGRPFATAPSSVTVPFWGQALIVLIVLGLVAVMMAATRDDGRGR